MARDGFSKIRAPQESLRCTCSIFGKRRHAADRIEHLRGRRSASVLANPNSREPRLRRAPPVNWDYTWATRHVKRIGNGEDRAEQPMGSQPDGANKVFGCMKQGQKRRDVSLK